MKIAIAQINPVVGSLSGNAEKILSIYDSVKDEVDLVIFPEMCLTGYPPQDLLLESEFISQTEKKLENIASKTGTVAAIVGSVRKDKDSLKNCAAVLQNGKIADYKDKTLLPTYDVFDEDRYFTPSEKNTPFLLKTRDCSVNIGLHICEDLWNKDGAVDVVNQLAVQGAELMINLSASPFSQNRINDRINLVRQKVKQTHLPYIYCNLVGAQDELIFDGYSFIINQDGTLTHMSAGFTESVDIINMDFLEKTTLTEIDDEEDNFKALSLGVQDYFYKTGHSTAVIGLSGGIDSALTTVIAADALGAKNVYGYALPSRFSSQHSIDDAKSLAENTSINFDILLINDIHKSMLSSLKCKLNDNSDSLALENLQARLRGNLLMTIANDKGALVLNTGNKTETALGYSTLYGDMCGALGVISDLNKHEVYAMANWINREKDSLIPENSITKPPSAELKPDQVDPFDYDRISPMVQKIITENKHLHQLVQEGYHNPEVNEVLRKIRYAEFKRRQAAPGLRISRKAFGMGRRFPIVNQFEG